MAIRRVILAESSSKLLREVTLTTRLHVARLPWLCDADLVATERRAKVRHTYSVSPILIYFQE